MLLFLLFLFFWCPYNELLLITFLFLCFISYITNKNKYVKRILMAYLYYKNHKIINLMHNNFIIIIFSIIIINQFMILYTVILYNFLFVIKKMIIVA